jgi:small subunit ribosomal protein S21
MNESVPVHDKYSITIKPEKAAIFMSKKKSNIEVSVIGNVDKALRQLKKKIEREGVVRDMKRTVYFEPQTQKRRKRLVRAIKMNMMRIINQGFFTPGK